MSPGTLFVVVPAAFVVFGVFFAWKGWRVAGRQRAFTRGAAEATGTITEIREQYVSSGSEPGGTWLRFPVVRFATPDGRQVETQVQWGSNLPTRRAGETVMVRYDPADPTAAQLPGLTGGGTFTATIFVVLGTLFALFGTFFLVLTLSLGLADGW